MNYLSPYVRVALETTGPVGSKLLPRIIYDYELIFNKQGRMEVQIGDSFFTAEPGDIVIFRPGVVHSFTVVGDEDYKHPHLHFDLYYREASPVIPVTFNNIGKIPQEHEQFFEKDMLPTFCENLPDHIKLKNPKHFENKLFEIIYEFDKKMPYFQLQMKGLLINLLVILMREVQTGEAVINNINYEQLLKIRNFIDSNYFDDITLDLLSSYANISKFYLSKLFASTFGLPPMKYFQSVRIQKAQELLKFTNKSITSIAEEVGYKDVSIFTRAFKNASGLSPREYKKINRMSVEDLLK